MSYGFGGVGTSPADAYGQAAESMGAAGVSGIGGGGRGGSSGPSPSSPAGGAQAAGGYSDGSRGGESYGGGGRGVGPSTSSPAGGAQAAGGYTDGSRDGYSPAPSNSVGGGRDSPGGSFGPSPSSPAGGAQVAAGYGDGSRGNIGYNPAPTGYADAYSQAAGLMGAAGIGSIGGRQVGLSGSYGTAGSARSVEDRSMNQYNAYQGILGTIKGAEANKVDPYNSLVYGNNTPKSANLTDMTIAQVMDFQKGMKAAGHASTAVGAYQTIASTLAAAVGRLGLPMDTKFTPAVQDLIAMDLIDQRAERAARSGLTAESLANQLSKEWAGLASATGKSAYDGIAGNKASVSYGTVTELAKDLIDSGLYGSNTSRSVASSSQRGETRASLPSTMAPPSFVSGRTPDLGPIPADKPGPTTARSPFEARQMAEYQYAGLTRSLAPKDAYVGLKEDRATLPGATTTETTTPAVKSAERFEEKYLSLPETAPIPSGRPETERSMGQKVAAGAIDIGLGLVPGIGTATGLFNAGAALTGNRTIGDRAVDMFQNAPGPTGVSSINGENDGAGIDRPIEDGAPPAGTPPKSTFESKYLGFVDRSNRQTPTEKWGGRRRAA